jgi:ribosome-associated translation inhibitor RaiA
MTIRIDIRARGLYVTDALWRHVVRRIERALRDWRVWVQSVEVQLARLTGAGRGGSLCRVLVRLTQLPPIEVSGRGEDPYAAIDGATQQAGDKVGQRLVLRLRTKRRFGMLHATRN